MDGKSVKEFVGEDERSLRRICFKSTNCCSSMLDGVRPLGTRRMSSHQVIGSFAYLLVLRYPISVFSSAASPHNSRPCASLRAGLASTR